MTEDHISPGMEGVIVGETAISTIEGGLHYRGYSIEELARDATFLETAYLLLYGDLPNQEQLADFQSMLAESAEVSPAVIAVLARYPDARLRHGRAANGNQCAGQFRSAARRRGRDANINKTVRLLAQIPQLIAARYRLCRGLPVVEPNPAAELRCQRAVSDHRQGAVGALRAGDGRLADSVRRARVQRVDVYGARGDVDAFGFVFGSDCRRRRAERSAARRRERARAGSAGGSWWSAKNAETWVRDALATKRRIMGFGHRVYKTGDPRAVILKDYCAQLAPKRGTPAGGDCRHDRIALSNEKGLPPNLDWPSARLYHYLGLGRGAVYPVVCREPRRRVGRPTSSSSPRIIG